MVFVIGLNELYARDLAKRRASSNFPLASRIDARQQELMEEKRALDKMMR